MEHNWAPKSYMCNIINIHIITLCMTTSNFIKNIRIKHASFFQVTQCQMVVDVHLLQFQNPKNRETRYNNNNGALMYCCCDTDTCKTNINAKKLNSCAEQCDTFFILKLSECKYPAGCLISTVNESITDSPPESSCGYGFTFTLNDISPQVSHCVLGGHHIDPVH